MAIKNETVCCSYKTENDNGYKYKITKNVVTGEYILYKWTDDKWVNTKHKSDNPLKLEKYIKLRV